jgi:CheY-like chemotaxis protein
VTKTPVLVVDDDEDFVEILRDRLAEMSYAEAIGVARDGVEALAYLRKEGPHAAAPTPALVLLDLKMPRKDGHEVLEEMRTDPALRAIPVVVLTNSSLDSDRERALAAGAAMYVTKGRTFRALEEILAAPNLDKSDNRGI